MKITLVHGENIETNYQVLAKLKNAYKATIKIYNAKVDISISNFFRSQDLFNESKTYLIEYAELLKDSEIKWIKENYKNVDSEVIIVANRELTQSNIKKFPPIGKVYKNDIPQYLWKFLDSIYPGNSKTCLALLQTTIETEPVEKIFTLIVNQIKDIYMLLIDANSLNYPSWRLSKLKYAASKFDISILEKFIRDLAISDNKSKLGENLYELLSFNLIKYL